MTTTITVRALTDALFSLFPAAWAEPWDHVGLSVGNPDASVRGVAVALDVSAASVDAAAERGANVLLTHHPVCLDLPPTIAPASAQVGFAPAAIWEAVKRDVAVISMHTNLDRSPRAALLMPQMLGLEAKAGIERDRTPSQGSLGALANLSQPWTLAHLAKACTEAFGRVAQVYGDNPGARLDRIAFCSGSMGGTSCEDVAAAQADAAVCGECGYHRALDLVARSCSVVVLGHDASELPHRQALIQAAVECGISRSLVFLIDEAPVWWQTDTLICGD